MFNALLSNLVGLLVAAGVWLGVFILFTFVVARLSNKWAKRYWTVWSALFLPGMCGVVLGWLFYVLNLYYYHK